jgi:hypothetical protein
LHAGLPDHKHICCRPKTHRQPNNTVRSKKQPNHHKMAVIVPYDVKNITANWSSSAKQFSVTANALLAVPFSTTEFKRLKRRHAIGRSQVPSRRLHSHRRRTCETRHDEQITRRERLSVSPSFEGISVVLKDPIKKAETTVKVDVTRDAFAPTPVPVAAPVPFKSQLIPAPTSRIDSTALPDIRVDLSPQNFIRTTARVPADTTTSRTTIEGHQQLDLALTWRAGQLPGFVYWDIAWAGNKTPGTLSSDINATTSVKKGTSATGASNKAGLQVTVQPYVITPPMLDSLDPDA